MKYKKIIIGGTFDLLHRGHKDLILKAFELGYWVSIGITSDEFNKSRGKETFEGQQTRLENLEAFLREYHLNHRANVIFINDIYGSALKDNEIEALIATQETIPNAKIVNIDRAKKGFKELEIITLPHAKDQQDEIISSTRIRNGEINTEGLIYKDLLLKIADKQISSDLLDNFKTPLGKVYEKLEINRNQNLISVGDIVTKYFFKREIIPLLSIIDFKNKREEIGNWISDLDEITKDIVKISNPPGTITTSLILTIEKALKNKKNSQIILIDGEEDLAGIPAILLCPLKYKVYYGEPGKGIVEVEVDQLMKEKVCQFLNLY